MINLSVLRGAEFECVKQHFRSGVRVLEIGGGNGYQASLIAALGANVASIDVVEQATGSKTFYPVTVYDGRTIPFESGVFDVVYSSNVLEHVPHLDQLLAEFRRVMKPDAVAIHILPSPSWRMWTSLTHYVHIGMRLSGRRRPDTSDSRPSDAERLPRRRSNMLAIVKRILWDGPHGEYPSAISELWYFSKARWMGVFKANGFRVTETTPSNIFYTGYGVLPGVSLGVRRVLARFLGSATRIYVSQTA
jgi:ubiquinone/menaquinone biosynthesis C-methylase UbiE